MYFMLFILEQCLINRWNQITREPHFKLTNKGKTKARADRGRAWGCGLKSHGMCSFKLKINHQLEQNLLIKDTECPRYSSTGPMPKEQTIKVHH